MNSLYLTYDGLTDPLGQSQILPYILRLEEKGIVFHIISFEKKEAFEKNEDLIWKIIASKNIHWYPLMYHKNPPVISTLKDLSFLWRFAKEVVKEHGIQIVHCRSYITALIGLQLKRKRRVKFIFDMRGFWVEERIEGGIWNIKNPLFKFIYQYFKKKEKQFFNEADAIISLTENAKVVIQEKFSPSTAHLISVIPCCTDQTLFNNSQVDKVALSTLEKTLSPLKGFNLLYLGSLGTWYMFDQMLDFYRVLIQQLPNSRFILLTNDLQLGHHKLRQKGWKIATEKDTIFSSPLSRFENEKHPESEIILTQSERKNVPTFIAFSDASIMFIQPSFSKKASSATKMGEVLSIGKPVITNSGWGDIELFKKEINPFYVVNKFEESDYQQIIKELLANKKAKHEIPSNFALEYFSLEKGVKKYYEVYKSLLT